MSGQSKPIVRIETVTAGHPRCGYSRSMFKVWEAHLLDMLPFIPIPPTLRKCADIPHGRNSCIQADMTPDKKWDYWLWIDDDQLWEPQDISYLVESMAHVDQCHAIISKANQSESFVPVVYDHYDPKGGYWHTWMTGWEEPKLYGPHNGYPTLYAGTGFTMIKREVFEKISKPWYFKQVTDRNRQKSDGHDLVFCKRIHEAGLTIGIDSRPDVGHFMETWIKTRQHFLKSGFQRNLLHKEWAAKPIQVSKKEDVNTPEYWDEAWSNPKMQTFYTNRKDALGQILPRVPNTDIKKEGAAHILHFGCANGWLLEAIQKDNQASQLAGIEVSPKAISLARVKVPEINIKRKDLKDFEAGSYYSGKYDMVIVTDWIERFPDPVKTMGELINCLKPDGQMILIFHDKGYGPDDVEEHHHLLSTENVGHLVDKLGGRTLEHTTFPERFLDNEGQELLVVPKVMMRCVFKEVEVAAPEEEVCQPMSQ